ncbi:MAG: glycosyltransferase family 4 protein, partial [Halanaerobiales bacterium]
MNVSFYIDNQNHKGVDYSNPEYGNPGVGGTQYMFWTIAYYLQTFYNDIEVNVIAPYIKTMPKSLNSYKAKSILDSVKIAKEVGSDILVLRGPTNNKKLFTFINLYKIKVVFWSHNFENWKFAELVSKCNYVERNICVGKEQLDRLRDHEIFNKSTYIYNALDFKLYDPYSDGEKNNKIVGYMGSLTKRKGFHKLAKNWKDIVSHVPEAKLYVLGGGDLYGKQWEMGSRNLTNQSYEKLLMKYLTNNSGEILPSVEFKGVVSGKEKLELLKRIRVGVANPTGVGETFCIVATEYEAVGTPVVAIKKN